ncbi:hypothetical protein OJ998_25190 [Solirubrobacter taibaiensis]|nr:hypothetical protein [Solirubrobacter taibaiensis]
MLKPALIPAALAALLLVPAPAQGACGVATAKADYESPEVQIYSRETSAGNTHYACLRATGRRTELGSDSEGVGSAATTTLGVYGRWVWLQHSQYDPDSDSSDVRHQVVDLRTGKQAATRSFSEVVALPGALVVASDGVTAHFTSGRKVKLSTDPFASGLAVVGSRVYWQSRDGAHTAVLELPKAAAAPKGPVATKLGRCVPRKGARLELFAPKLVLTRQGGKIWACRTSPGKTREVGAVTGLVVRSDREIAFVRSGKVATLNVLTGARTEVAGTAFAATGTRLLVVAKDGLHSPVDLLAAGPATEPALAGDYAYWLDGAGVPQVKLLT